MVVFYSRMHSISVCRPVQFYSRTAQRTGSNWADIRTVWLPRVPAPSGRNAPPIRTIPKGSSMKTCFTILYLEISFPSIIAKSNTKGRYSLNFKISFMDSRFVDYFCCFNVQYLRKSQQCSFKKAASPLCWDLHKCCTYT